MKGVKLDILAADKTVTALASMSLSATSAPGSGIALAEVKSDAAVRKVIERKGKNIPNGCQKRWKGRSGKERRGKGKSRMNEWTRRWMAKGDHVGGFLLVKCSLRNPKREKSDARRLGR